MLLGHSGTVSAEGDPLAGSLVWSRTDRLGVVVGRPRLAHLAATLVDVPVGFELVVPEDKGQPRDVVLQSWSAEGATLHHLVGEPLGSQATMPRGVDVRLLDRRDVAQLSAWPVDLRGEVERALAPRRAVGVFSGGELASVCCAGWVTESLWDVSIETRRVDLRKGFGRWAAGRLIHEMREQGKEPVWGAVDSNGASRALASALGFASVDRLVLHTYGS